MSASTTSRPTLLERVGWVPFACVIGAVVFVALAGITWNVSPYWGRSNVQAQARNVGSVPTAVTAKPAAVVKVPPPILPPNRIEIPKLKAVAPIVPVTTNSDGELEVPPNPKVVGWWSPGAKPGAAKGTAIFAGHINYAGVTGTLAQIGTLNPGDRVLVYGKHGTQANRIVFRVTGVRTYHKSRLPYREIFSQTVLGRLAIVTCGGPFDASTGNYLDNIVAYAVPVDSSKV